MLPCQGEGAGVVIEDAVIPASGYVTCSTIRSKLTHMTVILGMAGKTILGRPCKNSVFMAGQTTHTHVVANKRERSGVMVKDCTRPFCWLVTSPAVPAELPLMSIP